MIWSICVEFSLNLACQLYSILLCKWPQFFFRTPGYATAWASSSDTDTYKKMYSLADLIFRSICLSIYAQRVVLVTFHTRQCPRYDWPWVANIGVNFFKYGIGYLFLILVWICSAKIQNVFHTPCGFNLLQSSHHLIFKIALYKFSD